MLIAPTIARLTLVAVLAASVGCTGMFETPASRQIERAGASVSKSSGPGSVEVFAPETSDDQELKFGDEQLLAIIPRLRELPDFGFLNLSGSSVTDRSVSELASVPALMELYIQRTKVTAVGLASLAKCHRLREIVVAKGQFSTEELRQLGKSLPGVEISR